MKSRIVSAFFGLALIIGAFFIARQMLHERSLGSASANWPSVTGTVLSSRMESYGTGGDSTIGPEVTYTYEVAGEQLECTRIRFGAVSHGRQGASVSAEDANIDRFGRLPINSEIKVFYSPNNPAQATLVTGPTVRSLIGIGASVAMFAFAGVLLYCGTYQGRFAKL